MKKRIQKGHCWFCNEKKEPDYKDYQVLQSFISERGKILSRIRSAVCAKHQKKLARQIKRARHLALLPFVVSIK
jgi:small subunit ribosomal protein S18